MVDKSVNDKAAGAHRQKLKSNRIVSGHVSEVKANHPFRSLRVSERKAFRVCGPDPISPCYSKLV